MRGECAVLARQKGAAVIDPPRYAATVWSPSSPPTESAYRPVRPPPLTFTTCLLPDPDAHYAAAIALLLVSFSPEDRVMAGILLPLCRY